MRAAGINWGAVLVAAIAIYAIGFIIYGMLIPADTWMEMSGVSQAEMDAVGESRMPFGPVMPLMTATFLAILFKLGKVENAATGVRWALLVGLASAIPTLLYGWVYGVGTIEETLIDSAHLAAGHLVAGAILGGWR